MMPNGATFLFVVFPLHKAIFEVVHTWGCIHSGSTHLAIKHMANDQPMPLLAAGPRQLSW